MGNPFFTIIIPTYNHEKFLRKAIDSVIAQSFPDWEIVVVNDGSTDNTQKIIEDYSLKDSRITPIYKTNGGTASAINMGVENAKGEWICWLSSDDWYETDKLEIHKRYIEQNPNCRFFFSHFHMFNEYTGETVDRDLFGPLPESELQIPGLFYKNYIMGVGICVDHKTWNKAGAMDVNLKYAQDYKMWLNILTIAPGHFIPERTFTYRHHPGQGSETFQLACLFDASKAAICYVNEHPFKDYFPLLDLNNHEMAVKAIRKLLEIAGDPNSFIYSLGFHSALVFRLLEWISLFGFDNQGEYIAIVKGFANIKCKMYSGTTFGEEWRLVLGIIDNPDSDFTFHPVSHIKVAIDHYNESLSSNHHLAAPLKKYLESYEGINLDLVMGSKSSLKDRVLMLSPRSRNFIIKILNRIKRQLKG
jgi:glycosyltransferase involved in cell wall biosynthesis